MYQEIRKRSSTGLQVMPRFRGYKEEKEEPEAEIEGMDTKERKTQFSVVPSSQKGKKISSCLYYYSKVEDRSVTTGFSKKSHWHP